MKSGFPNVAIHHCLAPFVKESLQFDIGTIRAATENFSEAKKLGQGGFGVVYKVRNFVFMRCSNPNL